MQQLERMAFPDVFDMQYWDLFKTFRDTWKIREIW